MAPILLWALIIFLLIVLVNQAATEVKKIDQHRCGNHEHYTASTFYTDNRSYPTSYDASPGGPHGISYRAETLI